MKVQSNCWQVKIEQNEKKGKTKSDLILPTNY